jgi:hypothetical protein
MYCVRSRERVKMELIVIIATLADLEDRSTYKQDQIIINSVVLVAVAQYNFI